MWSLVGSQIQGDNAGGTGQVEFAGKKSGEKVAQNSGDPQRESPSIPQLSTHQPVQVRNPCEAG